MSGQEVLNQDEIDALLNGVDAGAASTAPPGPPGEARQYDFSREMRIVRGRMPTLEMVNERFARQLRGSVYTLLRRHGEVGGGKRVDKKVQRLHPLTVAAGQPQPREDQPATRHRVVRHRSEAGICDG